MQRSHLRTPGFISSSEQRSATAGSVRSQRLPEQTDLSLIPAYFLLEGWEAGPHPGDDDNKLLNHTLTLTMEEDECSFSKSSDAAMKNGCTQLGPAYNHQCMSRSSTRSATWSQRECSDNV